MSCHCSARRFVLRSDSNGRLVEQNQRPLQDGRQIHERNRLLQSELRTPATAPLQVFVVSKFVWRKRPLQLGVLQPPMATPFSHKWRFLTAAVGHRDTARYHEVIVCCVVCADVSPAIVKLANYHGHLRRISALYASKTAL